jgi:hypothetical protein
MLYRLHQIKGPTENHRGRGREETVKHRGDRDEYQKERQKRQNVKGKKGQKEIQTHGQIYKKMRKNKKRGDNFSRKRTLTQL